MRCAGALLPLVSMLQGADTDLQRWAADAMLKLAQVEGSIDTITAAGMRAVGMSPCAEPCCSCDQPLTA